MIQDAWFAVFILAVLLGTIMVFMGILSDDLRGIREELKRMNDREAQR